MTQAVVAAAARNRRAIALGVIGLAAALSVIDQFAMVAGGIDAAKLARWLPEYATDTIFLVGGSLLGRPDIAAAAEMSELAAGTGHSKGRRGRRRRE